MDDIVRSVIDIARHHVDAEKAHVLEDPDTDLSALGLDSLKMVNFLVDLEAQFSIEFPSTMMIPETFRNVQSVADSIRKLREQESHS